MKRIIVNEKWCLGCHLCEYNCAFANSAGSKKTPNDMVKALKDIVINPRIKIEEKGDICFAVSCRHCKEPLCVKSCIAGALTKVDEIIRIDKEKCVECHTCVLVCPYGAIMPSNEGVMQKCELCVQNADGQPFCVKGCPNKAIEYKEI
ncbi:MAG: 4Fe-4S ferredoxin [Clostridiales bacterium GWF2_36_10]|nr:MAG: 4Fe-4S ferredoxin [Clostridiales bacterium GWF2_36_10]HAN21396.1 4Fe-4S ferredoxin [Clostridiales bacterium]